MSRELPELPERRALPVIGSGFANHALGYTADQMRTYAEEAVRLEREACVAICESTKHLGYVPAEDGAAREYYDAGAADCADAIRARSQEGQG